MSIQLDIDAIDTTCIKAILFDLDGVIVDSEPLHHAAWRSAIAAFLGWELSWAQFETEFFGRADTEIVQRYAKHIPGREQDLLAAKNDYFCKHLDQITRSQPVIDYLLGAGKEMLKGVVSNALRLEVKQMFSHIGITDVFDVIVTADIVEQPKPDPDPYEKGFEELKRLKPDLKKEHVLVIEDSNIGVTSAQRAGMGYIVQRPFGHVDISRLLRKIAG